MRKRLFFVLLASVLLLSGCSGGGGSDAPSDTNAHPQSWFSTHGAEATASPAYSDCKTCHGPDLAGSGDAVSCNSCHSYNTLPPFSVHPAGWSNPFIDHRGYASANGFDSCTTCHGSDLQGKQTVPSCFTASFNGQSCHPDGPGQAPHPLDGSYLNGSLHGPEAKADLIACQTCHGQPGGPGSNPRFNLGIDSISGTGCEGCHGADYAHPQNWAGPNNSFHYSAGNVQNACTLCHGVNLDGVGGVGVSCLGCHAETASLSLDCAYCHGTPPDGSADLDVPIPVPHGNVSIINLHDVCVVCHGLKESTIGGSFSAAANYALFDYTNDVNGDHWNGNMTMNSAPQYNSSNFGCDAAGCHANDPTHQLSDSGLTVELKDFGSDGGSVPHPVDGSFLNPASHGPAAKGLTAAFPNGMLDCQDCHAQLGGPGSNPRFNVGIASAGSNGCEGCHNDFTAHPSDGSREAASWQNNGSYLHLDVNGFSPMCTLCHGVNLEGGVGPACTSCHAVDPVANPSGCVSCHNIPPDGAALAGANRPNREGRHSEARHTADCAVCHNSFAYGTSSHFDAASPADVVIQASFGVPAGTGAYDPVSGNCSNIICHGGSGTSEGPWY